MTSRKKKVISVKTTVESTDKMEKLASTKMIKMRKASSTTTIIEKDQRAF